MRENEALEHHATFVMTTLDDAITHIENYNYVTDHLHRTGATHQRFPDFSSENFGVREYVMPANQTYSDVVLLIILAFLQQLTDALNLKQFQSHFLVLMGWVRSVAPARIFHWASYYFFLKVSITAVHKTERTRSKTPAGHTT